MGQVLNKNVEIYPHTDTHKSDNMQEKSKGSQLSLFVKFKNKPCFLIIPIRRGLQEAALLLYLLCNLFFNFLDNLYILGQRFCYNNCILKLY